jgi:electron transfer flavoprotein alpha subunit
MTDILVAGANKNHKFELLAKARQLADETGGKVIATATGDQAEAAKEFVARGADLVVTSSDERLSPYQMEPHAAALLQIIKKYEPGIVLVADSVRARDVAAYVSTKLEVGCGSQWNSVELADGRLSGGRSYYSGRSVLTEKLTKDPQIATVVDRLFDPLDADESRDGTVEEIELDLPESKAKLVSHEEESKQGTNLEDATIVVSAGRGIKKEEDLKMIEELAQVIGGSVGCTRPLAADLKWLGDEHWIGLSGHKVKPQAYLGIGVSGQIQHVTGMRGSKLIIAINKDEDAPLVQISDYAIIDDLYKVLPAFIEAVKKIKNGA